ncbi:MAG: molybdopterin synthase sulfur carrier subunit [Microbacterium sp.]|nr:MAG: molybdopterin synthase sulfur carrier subunit [Microbacterium sp.]
MNTRPDTQATGAAARTLAAPTPAAPITVRLFAAAKAAVGAPEVALPSSGTIAEALAAVGATAIDSPAAERVFARCTFLVDGVAATDLATPLRPGATLDVLPPFAGG